MTREETKSQIAVMQAYVDGKDVEYKCRTGPDKWFKDSFPGWAWTRCFYRVAPSKPDLYEKWIVRHGSREWSYCDEDEAMSMWRWLIAERYMPSTVFKLTGELQCVTPTEQRCPCMATWR